MRGRLLAKIAASCAVGLSLSSSAQDQVMVVPGYDNASIRLGCERTDQYLHLLQGKRIAVVSNQTGMVGKVHLVDTLLSLHVNVVKVFAPEHGFRGDADAGATISDERDQRTGLPVTSLYGDHRKPSPSQLKDVDVLVFDIQDVGVRFYTYTSTLHYVMEAAAENGKVVMILDRPDPNGFYVDGPVLDPKYSSFIGMHPVPLVHGMTIGEYARMINGEGWLKGGVKCDLTVIPCLGYDHTRFYELPVPPSPNLKDMTAIYLYPSLGLFEGTIVSVGRGTDHPFERIGYPGCRVGSFEFTPRPVPGAMDPPYKGRPCHGLDLSEFGSFYPRMSHQIYLQWLIGMYQDAPDKAKFFTSYFDQLAGGPTLREQLVQGLSEEEIRKSWEPGLQAFRKTREKYLLYAEH